MTSERAVLGSSVQDLGPVATVGTYLLRFHIHVESTHLPHLPHTHTFG